MIVPVQQYKNEHRASTGSGVPSRALTGPARVEWPGAIRSMERMSAWILGVHDPWVGIRGVHFVQMCYLNMSG
jgi:hypothetical protein